MKKSMIFTLVVVIGFGLAANSALAEEVFTNSNGMKFAPISPGTFMMRSSTTPVLSPTYLASR